MDSGMRDDVRNTLVNAFDNQDLRGLDDTLDLTELLMSLNDVWPDISVTQVCYRDELACIAVGTEGSADEVWRGPIVNGQIVDKDAAADAVINAIINIVDLEE